MVGPATAWKLANNMSTSVACEIAVKDARNNARNLMTEPRYMPNWKAARMRTAYRKRTTVTQACRRTQDALTTHRALHSAVCAFGDDIRPAMQSARRFDGEIGELGPQGQ